jgi:hypothetical protein
MASEIQQAPKINPKSEKMSAKENKGASSNSHRFD